MAYSSQSKIENAPSYDFAPFDMTSMRPSTRPYLLSMTERQSTTPLRDSFVVVSRSIYIFLSSCRVHA